MGETATISLIGKRWKGLQKLKSRLNHLHAQYETHGGYELYHDEEYEKIIPKLPFLNDLMAEAIGKKDVFHPAEIPSGIQNFSQMLFTPYEGQLHPGFMMEQLKQLYLNLGGRIWTGLDIEAIEEFEDGVILRNKLSIPIKAAKVIVTTNAFANQLLPELDVHGARNHVIVTEPIPGLPWKGNFHYDKGFYYFRNLGERILLGGARNLDIKTEDTSEFGSNPLILSALKEFLHTHLTPGEKIKIEFQWSGIIGIGSYKLPIIKALSPRLFVGVRLSGMGIALASLIGEELADMVLQQ